MTRTSNVRQELTEEIARQGYTLSSFSKASGINRGVLSLTLNEQATKSFSMNQLNQMTEALGFPAGWLYELYTQEILADIDNVSWRRIKDLLAHCLQLGKMNLIETVLEALQDKPTYANYIFNFAEEIADQQPADVGRLAIFYQYVLDHETNLQAERFAISQYRLFRANLGLDLYKSLKATIRFASHRHALPMYLKLDALAQLINVTFALKDWGLLIKYGEELIVATKWVYSAIVNEQFLDTYKYERPLIVYYAKGYIAQSAGWEYLDKYEESKRLIYHYEDLSWFEILDSKDTIYVDKYRVVAKCNYYNIELLQGNYSALKSYMDYLEFFPEERPASLEVVLKASILYKWDIDEILIKYNDTIYPPDIISYLTNITDYSMIGEVNRYINIYHDLAVYYFERQRNAKALENILLLLKNSIEEYSSVNLFDSSELFEKIYKFHFNK